MIGPRRLATDDDLRDNSVKNLAGAFRLKSHRYRPPH